MSCLYTPQDLAVFVLSANLKLSDEQRIIQDIWKNAKSSVSAKYRQDFLLFQRHINLELYKYDGTLSDIDELDILFKGTEHAFSADGSIDEQDLKSIIESYFKVIKLKLIYLEGRDYRKIKLRKLLKRFGYKRRSAQLVNHIQKTLKRLRLKTYLKGCVPCSIAEVKLDDMIMIRLANALKRNNW